MCLILKRLKGNCCMSETIEKSPERIAVLERIQEFERLEKWNDDVEEDPESSELMPDQVDYLNKKLSSKIATYFANRWGTRFYEKMIKDGQFIIKEVSGIENFLSVKGGAIITCNHFNVCDNYAVWRSIKPYMGRKRLYKVIKEGNYTNSPPPFGLVMKHSNTLPLSRNKETMKNFMSAMDTLLKRGEKILIYPEQAMWYNYRKPRPLKSGSFRFAVASDVPVIPVFITMKDSENIGADGFPIQEYYVHFLEPIYADKSLPRKECTDKMREENYQKWVQCYEKFYGKKLKYK
ncbi:MAG: 1-acyl-sn-glycerol-3-phosphate acyltransferase [Clostridia bacterium]|nr:1-acyl-sn-glycerol-3-phosphate acyltransferase [Clostridia bacterium]